MALCCSQILIFNPSTVVAKSPDSRRFFTPNNLSARFGLQFRQLGFPELLQLRRNCTCTLIREVVKFGGEILKKLAKEKEGFGDSLSEAVNVCEQVLREFLLNEYGGPGTFLVEPFTYILVSLKEKKLPGAPLAAPSSLLWAQKHLDEDWKVWLSFHDKYKI